MAAQNRVPAGAEQLVQYCSLQRQSSLPRVSFVLSGSGRCRSVEAVVRLREVEQVEEEEEEVI